MAQFDLNVTDFTGRAASFITSLQANAQAAADLWAGVLLGQGQISIQVNIQELPAGGANGQSPVMALDHVENGISIYMNGAAYELRTGIDSSPSGPDIEINVDPDYIINELWLDPNPGAANPNIPAFRLDAISMFMHEMGHALGFGGFRDWATGVLPAPGNYMSTYDQDVVISGGHRYFVGANAQAVYGGPVMLNDGNYHHYGNSSGPLDGDLTNGLMNGVVFVAGRRSAISELDLAILKDTGLQVMSEHNDTLSGFATNDAISGRGGSDIIDGADGHDMLHGDAGNDIVRGGAGQDVLWGGSGNDWLEGDTGNDPLVGVAGNDTIFGDDGDDTVLAGAGDDTLYGGTGTDALVGEDGNDIIFGGWEWDLLDGRAGVDFIYGEAGADIIFGDAGEDQIDGGDGDDLIMGERGENTSIGDNDNIVGGAGNDMLDGSAGDDLILGGTGNDIIDGDVGNDRIIGGPGAEIIAGSDYNHVTGRDTFIYQSMGDAGDWIYGFRAVAGDSDKIDVTAIYDAAGYTGTTPIADGFLMVQQSGGNTYIYIDTNGPAGGANWVSLLSLSQTTLDQAQINSYFVYQ